MLYHCYQRQALSRRLAQQERTARALFGSVLARGYC